MQRTADMGLADALHKCCGVDKRIRTRVEIQTHNLRKDRYVAMLIVPGHGTQRFYCKTEQEAIAIMFELSEMTFQEARDFFIRKSRLDTTLWPINSYR